MVGTEDPLHDDCIRFTERLLDASVDVKTVVYEDWMHGFLSFEMPMGVKETRKAVDQMVKWIREIRDI